MQVKIIYPERRIVHEEQMMVWAEDDFHNGKASHMPTDIWDAMEIEEDLGKVTFDWAWAERHN